MNALLWTLQGSLAAIFTASGLAKISQPKDRLIASGQTGVTPFPVPVIRVTVFCELLGAIGILVPMLVRVAEFLTLREPRNVAATVAIFIAAVTVAVGRTLGA
jgi:uncharacterized membrane protein YphA (DoxX/SURF4 family)